MRHGRHAVAPDEPHQRRPGDAVAHARPDRGAACLAGGPGAAADQQAELGGEGRGHVPEALIAAEQAQTTRPAMGWRGMRESLPGERPLVKQTPQNFTKRTRKERDRHLALPPPIATTLRVARTSPGFAEGGSTSLFRTPSPVRSAPEAAAGSSGAIRRASDAPGCRRAESGRAGLRRSGGGNSRNRPSDPNGIGWALANLIGVGATSTKHAVLRILRDSI